jgi:hypothetical protein
MKDSWLLLAIAASTCSLGGIACDRASTDELVKPAGSAAAPASSAAPAVSSAAPAAEASPAVTPPALEEQAFSARKPSSLTAVRESTSSCALDRIGEAAAEAVTTVTRAKPVALMGWAAHGATGTSPPVVVVELAGKKRFFAPATRVKRPGIAADLKVPGFLNSGYDLLASFRAVDPGEYTVRILQVSLGGDAFACDTKKKIKVQVSDGG